MIISKTIWHLLKLKSLKSWMFCHSTKLRLDFLPNENLIDRMMFIDIIVSFSLRFFRHLKTLWMHRWSNRFLYFSPKIPKIKTKFRSNSDENFTTLKFFVKFKLFSVIFSIRNFNSMRPKLSGKSSSKTEFLIENFSSEKRKLLLFRDSATNSSTLESNTMLSSFLICSSTRSMKVWKVFRCHRFALES